MNKLFCLFGNSDLSRFVFDQEQGGESFKEEARRKAKELNKDIGESVDSAGRAVASVAKTVGEGIVGTAKEVPGVLTDAHDFAVDKAANLIEGALSGITDLHADMVEKMANTFVSIDENISGAKKAAWEEVKPVVAVLVGMGYLALNKVEKIAGEAKDFSVAKLNAAIDWAKVSADYVKDGAVNLALASKELGTDAAQFLNDSYESMVSGTKAVVEVAFVNAKAAGRAVAEFHEGGIDRVARMMLAIDNGVTGTAKKAWETARPVVAVLIGEGYLAAEKMAELGNDAKKFTMAKLEKAVDLGKFAANYVKDGVVDKAKAVAELGKDAGKFVVATWDKAAEKTGMALNEAMGLAVAAGREMSDFHEAMVDEAATDILIVDNTVTGAAKKSWETVRPAVVVLAGQGYLAADTVAQWAGDAKDWSAEKLYAALDYGRFAVDYVKDGVVDMKRVAEDFGKDAAEKVARVYQKAAERVGEHIELAQAEGYRILDGGKAPSAPVESMWAKVWKSGAGKSKGAEVASSEKPKAAPKKSPSYMGILRTPESKEDSDTIYVVKKGDTMISIAKKYYGATDMQFALDLQKNSGEVKKLDSGKLSFIKPGQEIKLPKTFKGRNRLV